MEQRGVPSETLCQTRRGRRGRTGRTWLFFLLALWGWAWTVPECRAADISLLVLDANSYLVGKALADLRLPKGVTVEHFPAGEIKQKGDEVRKKLQRSRVLIVDVMGKELEEFVIGQVAYSDKTVYAVRGSTDDERLQRLGFVFDDAIAGYYRYLSVANIRNMVRLAAARHFGGPPPDAPPERGPAKGIYHPAAGIFDGPDQYLAWYTGRPAFRPDRPWIGVLFFSSSLAEGQRDPIDYLCNRLEAAGFNVMAAFGPDAEVIRTIFLPGDSGRRIDLLLALSLKFSSALTPELARLLDRLDVPIVNGINLYRDSLTAYRKNPVGLTGPEVTWTMTTPEISGLVEPTVVSGKEAFVDEKSGKPFYLARPLPENVDRLIRRLRAWTRLQRLANGEKRLAVMYYNHPQGKQNIGASYLNVFSSLALILDALGRAGYDLGKSPPRLTAGDGGRQGLDAWFKKRILASGRNIGSWAPGELDRLAASDGVVRLPLAQYKEWFSQLPAGFRAKVLEQWGPPEESKIMFQDGAFIIPAVRLGKVVLLPEPSRGWSDDPEKLFHDTTLYPHHQYLAVYLWLQHSFGANAMIHLGTHATYEWTPGRQAGLLPADTPEVLIGDIPNLYPYVVDDVGEGIQAKRRGRGVIVSHLVPVLRETTLYGDLRRLAELLDGYERAVARSSDVAGEKLREIIRLVKKNNMLHEIGLAALPDMTSSTGRDAFLHRLGHYLEEVNEDLMPYGLHTFGRAPQGAELADMARSVVRWNPESNEQEVMRRIAASGRSEMASLLRGLAGRYVPPGEGGDPVRNPDSLPTGRNFYGFDPARVPTPAAWRLGKKAADEIIAAHLAKEGRRPAKVAVVLWATETQRNEGVNESTILWLMGLRPRWTATGRVAGVEVVPGRLLGRPRIDVMINASGLYRDLFPGLMEFLDRAVQIAARQTDVENLIARHNQELKAFLVSQGMEEGRAERLSRVRIFSEGPGSYGTGVAETAARSDLWDDDARVAEVFENRTGFAFGQGVWGERAPELLRRNLAGVEAVVHSRSSNLYGLLDNDDVFQYLGGLSLSVRKESGKQPATLVIRQQRAGQLEVEDLARSIGREMRSRYLNPAWLQGMMREGYAGAREMAKFVEYLWGWQVTTPGKVTEAQWQATYETYVEDALDLGLDRFFDQGSPWALQSITGRLLEVARKQYWTPSQEVMKRLAARYAMSVVQQGVACCDHTCNNPMLNQMVVSLISLPGVLPSEMVEAFKLAIENMAGGKPLAQQVTERRALKARLADRSRAPGGKASKKAEDKERKNNTKKSEPKKKDKELAAGTGAGKGEEVEGYKMEKIDTQDDATRLTSSGVQWLAALVVLAMIGLFWLGARRRR